MYCPVCRAEYREGFTRCADCDAELVAALPERTGVAAERALDPATAVALWRGWDPVLFSAIEAALRGASIPHVARHLTRHQEAFLHQQPYDILVRQEDVDRARDVVRELLESTPPA